jgi:hypothetical protein
MGPCPARVLFPKVSTPGDSEFALRFVPHRFEPRRVAVKPPEVLNLQKDIDDRLCRHAGNRRTANVVNGGHQVAQGVSDSGRFPFERALPRWIVRQYFDVHRSFTSAVRLI